MKDFKFFQKKELEWYNPDENYTFAGVTPMMYNPHTFIPSKCIMYRNLTTNEIFKGEVINEGHPFWNYRDETI
jgi:hypothetical protein